MKYSVKSKSPVIGLFPLVAIAAGFVVPFENWAQTVLLGVALGALASLVSRGLIQRSFEPEDAPLSAKRKIVAGFALARLIGGFVLVGLSALIFADWLAPGFMSLGGYIVGTTAGTPLREKDFS